MKGPFFLILGDLNPFPDREITSALNFKQVFSKRGENTLDIITKNFFYENPTSLPHLGNINHLSLPLVPKTNQVPTQLMGTELVRRFPDSKIREFGPRIANHDWGEC